MMDEFIRNDQYNFIKVQVQTLINGYSSVHDTGVLEALTSLTTEKVLNLFSKLTDEQKQLLSSIVGVKNKQQAEDFLLNLKQHVVPFKEVTVQEIKKCFPKVKKLKLPLLDTIEWKEHSYLGWDDFGAQKKYIMAIYEEKLIGLQGSFKPLNKKGFCVLCHQFDEIGMFMAEIKGNVQGTFTNRGNHICKDSQNCNRQITSLERLNNFISLMKARK